MDRFASREYDKISIITDLLNPIRSQSLIFHSFINNSIVCKSKLEMRAFNFAQACFVRLEMTSEDSYICSVMLDLPEYMPSMTDFDDIIKEIATLMNSRNVTIETR